MCVCGVYFSVCVCLNVICVFVRLLCVLGVSAVCACGVCV